VVKPLKEPPWDPQNSG